MALNQARPGDSVFGSIPGASDFCECGSLGYSATYTAEESDGLELRTFNWEVLPLSVERAESSFFENRKPLPVGAIEFDCALLMRNIKHEWPGRPSLPVRPSDELQFAIGQPGFLVSQVIAGWRTVWDVARTVSTKKAYICG